MFPEIMTERLLLRSLQAADAETLFAYRRSKEVLRFQSWEPQSLEEVQTFINGMSNLEFNTPGWYQIAVVTQGAAAVIGDCGIHFLEADARIVEIGITIAPEHQSKGYATEALKAVLNLLFDKLGKHRVYASVDPSNLASMALMERIGMRKEGLFIQSIWFKDSWVDDVVFAMLANEWHSKNRKFA